MLTFWLRVQYFLVSHKTLDYVCCMSNENLVFSKLNKNLLKHCYINGKQWRHCTESNDCK